MNGPRRIWLVRHGESAANAGGVTMPHAEIPLTERGREQALAVVTRLPSPPARVLASPFLRAVDTARPYADRHGRPIEAEPLLQEFDMIDPALLAGLDGAGRRPIADACWHDADPDRRMGTQAESFRDFAGRVASFLTQVLPSLPDGSVCFGHGIWIGMAAWQLLGCTTVDGDAMRRFRRFQGSLPMHNTVVYRCIGAAPGVWSMRVEPTGAA